MAALRVLWRALWRRRAWEAELDEELRLHLECRADDLLRTGIAPEEARRRARVELGLERVKEECREAHRWGAAERLAQDVRYGVRSLARSPMFTIVAALTLALGIGANTTIFSVVNAVLLRPLPLHEPDRLVVVQEVDLKRGGRRNPTAAAYLEWKKHVRTLESMGRADLYSSAETLTGMDRAERIGTSVCSPELLSVVGVQPALGRRFSAEPQVDRFNAILTDVMWRRKFGADAGILGKTINVGGRQKTVIGVLPPGFSLLPWDMETDVWYPHDPAVTPASTWMTVIGRLKPDVSAAQAEAELSAMAANSPDHDAGWQIRVQPLHDYETGGQKNLLALLLGAVGFILLIACVNVANLLLARGTTRHKELAIRASLGAGRFRLVQQLLIENMLLALAGGALGAAVAVAGVRILTAVDPMGFLSALAVRADIRVLGFTAALSILTGLLFGLVPSIRAARPDLNESLKEGGRQSASGGTGAGQGLLLVCEVALAVVLLAGAGLTINSFIRSVHVPLGFNPSNVLQAEVELGGPKYYQLEPGDMKRVTPQVLVYFEQVLQRMQAIPGVVSASVRSLGRQCAVTVVGRPATPGRSPNVEYTEVSPGYFRNLEIPLRRGRGLSDRDTEASPWVLVINEAMARQLFPNEDPIGRQVRLGFGGRYGNRGMEEDRPREIVGIVADTRRFGMKATMPAMYGTFRQHMWVYAGPDHAIHDHKKIELRVAGNPMSFATAMQKAAAEVDRDQALYNVRTLEETLSLAVVMERFLARMFGIFAGLALFLAAVGIYGVLSYLVSRRTHEVGIRMALGASRGDVLRLVIGGGLKTTSAGLAIGIAASLALSRIIGNRLFQVQPTDPLTYTAVALVLAAVALAACYIPARRATRVDPLAALRHD